VITVFPIVEGQTEVYAFPTLVRRIEARTCRWYRKLEAELGRVFDH
jgi:hypothetical protein